MTAVDGDQAASGTYDVRALQDKWQARWAAELPFTASETPADERPRSFIVDMFAYPSGDLHMGHAEAFAIGDVIGRYRFQRGDNVLHRSEERRVGIECASGMATAHVAIH